MKINIAKLVPLNWAVKDKVNKIKIFYHNRRARPIALTKNICIDEEFMEGLGLFLGDSDLNKKDIFHLAYTSKDKDIAKHALNFLIKKFKLNVKHISFNIQYKTSNEDIEQEWASYLHIQKSKICTRFSNRHRYECISIQVNSVLFKRIFKTIVKEVLNSDFIKNKNLRRGLLKGLFAAEGCVGINYKEKKPYINQITYNLSIKETGLKDLICNALKLEKIDYRIKEYYKANAQSIIIERWNNYIKLWRLNIFDLCKRKKNKFIEIAKRLDVYLKFNSKFRKSFFQSLNMYQREIANKIGSWQANVCRTVEGIHLLKIEQTLKLQPYSSFTTKQIIKNVEEVRIGCLTKLDVYEAIEFLKEFKSI